MLSIGDVIPMDIKVLDIHENSVSLHDFLSHDYLIIYFYPKDMTSGCTTEACSFRDFNKEIEKRGGKVIGISKDSVKQHKKFIEKENLNFELLSDESTELQRAFGVWVEKSMYGRTYMGTQRSTFLVDEGGSIIYIWEKVKPAGHAKEVFEMLQTLSDT